MQRGCARRIAIAIACVAAVSAGCSKSGDGNGSGTTGPTGAGATGAGGGGASLAASGPTASSPAASPAAGGGTQALAGTWSGTWQNTEPAPATGTFQIHWTASGSDALSGTIDVAGTPCLTSGKIVASLQGGKISFGVVQGQSSINYTGSVSGNSMSGTYSASATCANAKGNWKATKTG